MVSHPPASAQWEDHACRAGTWCTGLDSPSQAFPSCKTVRGSHTLTHTAAESTWGQKTRLILAHLKGKSGLYIRGRATGPETWAKQTKVLHCSLEETLEVLNPCWLPREMGGLKKKDMNIRDLGVYGPSMSVSIVQNPCGSPKEPSWSRRAALGRHKSRLCPSVPKERSSPRGMGEREHPCWLTGQCTWGLSSGCSALSFAAGA